MATLFSMTGSHLCLLLAASNAFVLCKPSAENAESAGPLTASPGIAAPAATATATAKSEPPPEAPSAAPPPEEPTEHGAIAKLEPREGLADLDPDNDSVVAPPEAVHECAQKLKSRGLKFEESELPFREAKSGFPRCGAFDAVLVKKTKSGIALRPPALMGCRLALAMTDLDGLFQELSEKHFHEPIVRLDQAGTYSCRKMQRFDLVSEHSYGNAIDILSFTLKSGKKLTVLKNFGELSRPRETLESKFLHEVGEQAFTRNLVSVSLGPYWDALHKDHFHFDLAHYRVDGSRPQ